MWELCRRPSPCSFSPPDCHPDCRLLCRVTALGFVGFGGTQWDEGKGESRLGWSLVAPPSCASSSRFTRLGSSPGSCFLYLQTILGEGVLVHQRPHYGGRGCTMVAAIMCGWGAQSVGREGCVSARGCQREAVGKEKGVIKVRSRGDVCRPGETSVHSAT